MNKASAHRVRSSFEARAPDMPGIVREFETRFFEWCPDVRGRLPVDLAEMEREFIAALAMIARNIDRIDVLEEPLMQLGAQLTRKGARPGHFAIARDALIESLAHASGPSWTDQLQRDWFLALTIVCEALLRGALRSAEHRAATPISPARPT
jgi:hemoglobin-like flavoprotein